MHSSYSRLASRGARRCTIYALAAREGQSGGCCKTKVGRYLKYGAKGSRARAGRVAVMLSQMRCAWMERDSWLACALLGGFSRSVSWAEEDIEDNEGGADGDGGVGDVESGIVVGAEPDFEEIRYGAVEDAIGDVAGGAAEKKCQARGGEAAAAMAGDEEPGENGDDDERTGDEDDARPG